MSKALKFSATIIKPADDGIGVTIDDFVAYMPSHIYIFTPCREPWTQSSVNGRLPRVPVLDKHGHPKRKNGKLVTIAPSQWLDQNRPVEQMTWCPGYPMLIKDRLVVDGGWIERPEVTCFNHYRPPRIELGNAAEAGPWLDHVHKIYPDDANHIITWVAHRVQRPQEKINHRSYLAVYRASARTHCLSRSSTLSARGTSAISARSLYSGGSTALPKRSFYG
jgi:hypothetical protein